VRALVAPLGLIVTLSIAVVVLTFNSFRLTLIAFAVAGLSAGLSILSLAVFDYPFGINAIIGVIGSIGVSINAALIVLSGLQDDPRAATGDRQAMVDVVAGSARHITSTTITTMPLTPPVGGGLRLAADPHPVAARRRLLAAPNDYKGTAYVGVALERRAGADEVAVAEHCRLTGAQYLSTRKAPGG
jgi:hypothetical protein